MSLLESHWITGVACDVPKCTVQERLGQMLPRFGDEARRYEEALHGAGWATRYGRSVHWYCPDHADRAGRCVKGRWGMCSPHCPVHGHGRVVAAAEPTTSSKEQQA